MPMQTYSGLVEERDLLDFSQNFQVSRNYMGSRLFPDVKTQYIDVEYMRLCKNGNLPMMAMVHAFDTEAHIATRIPMDKVEHEKLLIKEKINQTESLRQITRGMMIDGVKRYVFDDVARLAESVVTRVEAAKMEVLATGKMTIAENKVKMTIDYGVPDANRVETYWDDPNADILGDLREWRLIALDNGVRPNVGITTEAVLTKIMTNATIQKAIFGASGTGILPTLDQINALFQAQVGITLQINEDRYGVVGKETDGSVKIDQARFWPEDIFVMTAIANDGSIGSGLWGVTPEEETQGQWTSLRQQQFVTVAQWTAQDPVAVWTKASGLFIPVLPNVWGHVIANVAVEPEDDDSGTDSGGTKGNDGADG